jgi:hypothetical protein
VGNGCLSRWPGFDGPQLEGYSEFLDIRVALLVLATVPAASAPTSSTVEEFQKAAAVSQKFLDLRCVLYDRRDRQRDCADQAGAELHGDYPTSDLAALTRHPDPRVRTLALVCLFDKGDATLLPLIFKLAGDPGSTFPARTPVAYLSPPQKGFSEIPQTPQTVGSVAEGMLSFYLTRAGYSYGSRAAGVCLGFPDYWAQRNGRDHLASWFTVQLDRATQGTSPIPGDRGKAFAALRARLDALEGEDRLWYSLFVGASEGGDRVFSEAELLAVSKALGPDRLMLMLANLAPASDPDLVSKPWPSTCGHSEVGEGMRNFVLNHASQLLRPVDAKALLESPKARYAQWAIAAAALRPDLAEGILKKAIANLDRSLFGWDQAKMAAALPRIAGAAHTAYALDWFYGRLPAETMTTAQEVFITEVVDRSGPGGRAMLARLVLEPRFETIPEPALRALIFRINPWLPTPLVEWPYASVTDNEKKAIFAEWRRAVRDSVPRWNGMP